MSKWEIVKLEKGTVMKPSLTKAAWRRKPGTAAYPQPDKFEVQYKYLKGSLFDCLGGSNTEDYSKPMKEVSEYIGWKFDYGT